MKTTKVFEDRIREANYASLDAARTAIKSHPLVADYLVDMLIARDVIKVCDDGTVVGTGRPTIKGRADPKDAVSTEWKPNWPSKDVMIGILDNPNGVKFRDLQEQLIAEGEQGGHWLCLHAIWNLMKAGKVEKDGKVYRLIDGEPSKDAPFVAKKKPDNAWFDKEFDAEYAKWPDGGIELMAKLIRDFGPDPKLNAAELNKTPLGRSVLGENTCFNERFLKYSIRKFTLWGCMPETPQLDT